MGNALTLSGERFKKRHKWKKKQSTADWVESNVILTAEVSPMTGAVQLKMTPHLREFFDDYDKKHVWCQIGKWSTQTAKTLGIQVLMAHKLDKKPRKIQWGIPNEDKVTEYIEDKIEPFVKCVRSLQEKVDDFKDAEKLRTKKSRIKVAGGDCVFTGSSASSKRSKTVAEVYLDEADLMVDGSIIEFQGRTKAFERFGRKFVAVSSQKKENGEIKKAYDSCEMKKEWHTPCECGHHWLAGSKDLKWLTKKEYMENNRLNEITEDNHGEYKKEALKSVHLECPECATAIKTEDKDRRLLNGEYFFHVICGDENSTSIGSTGNALAMYFTRFETIASLIIDAEFRGTFDDMAQIYLDYFDEIYKDEAVEKVSKNDILLLGNNLSEGILPHNTAIVVMGIDTQKNHFWYEIKAYEYGNKSHTILCGRAETTNDLESIMGMVFECEDGSVRGLDKVAIDRKGIRERTIEVDEWVESLIVNQGMEDFIYLSEGRSGKTMSQSWNVTDHVKDLRTDDRRKVPLKKLVLNNLLLKNELQNTIDRSIARVNAEDGSDEQDYSVRLFFINQTLVDMANGKDKSVSTDYERQITSENYVYYINPKTGKVDAEKSWQKRHTSVDNHFFDTSVICTALSLMMNINTLIKHNIESVELDDVLPD